MADYHIPSEIEARYLPRSQAGNLFLGFLVLVGLVSFFLTLSRSPIEAWRAYVSNWLFFTSVAQGAVILAVVTSITKAKWNWSVRRVSLAFVAFLPISFVLFLPMLGLGESYFPWVEEMAHDPILQNKAAYLNLPFLITRDLVGLLLLFGLSLYFAYLAVRPDLGLVGREPSRDAARDRWKTRLTQAWIGQEQEEVRSWQRMTRLAPAIVLVYAAVMSTIAYDWVMSLEPHWFSTLFGGWFFMGAFWGGIALTAFTTTRLKRRHPDFDRWMARQQLHDLGKLAFAFCVFWTYLFFSQYIVIWYGKLVWENEWFVHRAEAPFGALSVLVICLCFVIPFAGLIGRRPKMRPPILATLTGIILVGLWLERYVMIAPALHDGGPAMTIWQPLIGLLFLGLFIASARWFFATFPVVQMWQPMSQPEMLEAEAPMDAEGQPA